MKTSASKTWPTHSFHFEEDRPWESALRQGLDAIRRPIQKHPLKFVLLSMWTAFFLGLVVRG